jgi:hypothetical protein
MNTPSDYYGELRKCFLTLKPIEELPELAHFCIEMAFKLQETYPAPNSFVFNIIQWE